MACWSKSKNGFELDDDEVNHVNHNVSCFDLDFTVEGGVFEDCKDSLQRLFDQVMPIYLREVSVGKIARPLPALLGDGQPVDLFRLFWVVKTKGGFRTVSEKGLWGSVAEECLLNATLTSSVKLVYIKYLREFDGWLQRVFRDKRSEAYVAEISKKLDLLIVESEERTGQVWSGEDKMGDDGELGLDFDDKSGSSVNINGGNHRLQLSGFVFNKVHHNKENIYDETGSCVDLGTSMSDMLLSNGGGDLNKENRIVESSIDSEKNICIQGDESIMSSVKCVGGNVMRSKKIKLSAEVELDKPEGKVEASRSDDDNKKLRVQDDYDILLSARSVVDKVISSMKSDFCSLPEVDNVQENVENTYNDDEKTHDDYDLLLSARRIVDKVISSQNEGNNLWPRDVNNEVHENGGNIKDNYEKEHIQDDLSVELSSTSVGNEAAVSRKRKWESISLPEMLNWITQAAKRSNDPAIGIVPGPSKWNDHGTEEYWMQALLAREALLIKRPINANHEESSLQKKPRMHPSMYEDINSIHQSAERVRCSKRVPSSKSPYCPCCSPGPATSKLASPRKAQNHDRKLTPSPFTEEVPRTPALNASHEEEASEKHVSVGFAFQAEVPEWTGVVLESDSKWLGTRMWAPEDGNKKTLVGKHPIGKGRQSSCDCSLAGSSACIKFHIAEKRLKLKLALGGLFYSWKFDRMGEEVSLSWTTEEEKKFKNMVLNSTALNKFWKNAFRLFPSKTREKLVSYYFNVLVLRRRSYQNRVTPKNIDSDDDETEFGSVGDCAYSEGNHALEYNLPECPLNMQYTNLE
ncbi:AT-rich interactive domain-containing protein 2 [Heracleum sosnowskyi]|uniref:AT-rich interactive domain-containing protein 2 n=1 Tax=Heracleum sosnowskyi TaxID=360622 RepID=A0AAD8GRJ5_9APIA|nr:AT-rich interactive domain-containing protein 2 [Heracleum sosnowskyi]